MSSVVIKSIDRKIIILAINDYVARLRQDHPEIEHAIWFGSWVNGQPTPGSDVDLCLIVSHSDQPRHARVSQYLPRGFPVGVDLFVYTREEFDHLEESSPGWRGTIEAGMDLDS